ncbi:hypothetical protein [Pararhizobium sp. IMCC21322]|uniref:hypothetical protein n=1 Tax=Pararhizobium sp. IMCC21322 TaxID=3067903 RepID=UPI00274154E9|nr:hypothetical protein [Pararhizobium sp. IMCC21322]
MKFSIVRKALATVAIATLAFTGTAAKAEYPEKPVTFVLPNGAGGLLTSISASS